jgi:selenophosphate synthase
MLPAMNTPGPRLTSLSHGGSGCKIAPGVPSEIHKGTSAQPLRKGLTAGIETAADAAVYRLNDEQALVATTGFGLAGHALNEVRSIFARHGFAAAAEAGEVVAAPLPRLRVA